MKISGFQDTLDWYQANAQSYTKGYYKYGKGSELEAFTKLIPKAGKVLDAGCAAGRDSKYLVDEGLNITGIDLVEAFITQAKRHVPKGIFLQGSFLNLPFDDEALDGVWSNASLLHFETIEEVQKALQEFHRVLKKNGALYVNVKAQMGDEKFNVVKDALSNHNRFFQFFTLEEIKHYIEEAAFEIITIEQYNEKEKHPNIGREEVDWIWCLARKR